MRKKSKKVTVCIDDGSIFNMSLIKQKYTIMGMHLVKYPKGDTLDFMWQGYDVRMFLGLKFLVSIFWVAWFK